LIHVYPASSFSAAIVAAVRSRVQTDEPSPKALLLARSIPSSRLACRLVEPTVRVRVAVRP
jgi:hypothetical protein